MKNARTHALRIRIAPQRLTPNTTAAPITTAAHKTHPTHTQNSTAFKRPVARSLSAIAQKLSNVFNAARNSLAKTHYQNSTAFSTTLKRPTARLTATTNFTSSLPTRLKRASARPVSYLRASRRAVCFFIHTPD